MKIFLAQRSSLHDNANLWHISLERCAAEWIFKRFRINLRMLSPENPIESPKIYANCLCTSSRMKPSRQKWQRRAICCANEAQNRFWNVFLLQPMLQDVKFNLISAIVSFFAKSNTFVEVLIRRRGIFCSVTLCVVIAFSPRRC